MTPLQKLPKNVKDLSKLIVAKGIKKLPKVQKLPNLVTLTGSGGQMMVRLRGAMCTMTIWLDYLFSIWPFMAIKITLKIKNKLQK